MPLTRSCETIAPQCVECAELSGDMPYTFIAGLTPDTSYYVFFRDKFLNIYSMEITTGEEGGFEITDDNYPGLFNQYAGSFSVWISENESGSPRTTLTIDEVEYTCINLTITCD
jgi:hypothetical protein